MLYSDHSEDTQDKEYTQAPSRGRRMSSSSPRQRHQKQCRYQRHTILGVFGAELCLLLILFLVAGSQKQDGVAGKLFQPFGMAAQSDEDSWKYLLYWSGAYEAQMPAGTSSLLQKMSPLYANFLRHETQISQYLSDRVNQDMVSSNKPTSAPSDMDEIPQYRVFRYSLGAAGYTVHETTETTIPGGSGIREDLSGGLLTIENRGELQYGFLKIVSNAYVPTFKLQDVLTDPLVIPAGPAGAPRILLYHSHTEEGYCVTEADKYSSESYTKDSTKNVVFAGNSMQQYFQKNTALSVMHDTTVNQFYDMSRKTVERLLKANPSIYLTVDIHRNSIGGSPKYGPTVSKDGVKYAPLQFVVSSTNNGGDHPNWKENFKLALLVLARLEEKVPGITRGIATREDPYNQNIAEHALLVEIGFDGNYLEEIQASSELLAEVLGEIYSFE